MIMAALAVLVVLVAWALAFFRSGLAVWTVAVAAALGSFQWQSGRAGLPWAP